MVVFGQKKYSVIIKSIAILLVHTFVMMSIAPAYALTIRSERATLSPKIGLSAANIQNGLDTMYRQSLSSQLKASTGADINLTLVKAKLEEHLSNQLANGEITEGLYKDALAKTYKNLEMWLTDPDIARLDPGAPMGIIEAIQKEEWSELVEVFRGNISFGTAGIRGKSSRTEAELLKLKKEGPFAPTLKGPNNMNPYVILEKTAGVIRYMKENGMKKVAIGYDSRVNGEKLAEMIAEAFVGASTEGHEFQIFLFDEASPFPELSYGLTTNPVKADIGILISASHNPSNYNGYKLTNYTGSQLPPSQKPDVVRNINKVRPSEIVLKPIESAKPGNLIWLGGEKPLKGKDYKGVDLSKYFIDMHKLHAEQVKKFIIDKKLVKEYAPEVKIGFSAFNGSGYKAVPRLLSELGFSDHKVISKLQDLDGMFPAFGFGEQPDPGDPISADVAVREFIAEHGQNAFDQLDNLIGTDPDADRMGMIVRVPEGQQAQFGKYRLLSANDTWTLLVWYRLMKKKELGQLKDPSKHYVTFTHVTTDAIGEVAAMFGVPALGEMPSEDGSEDRGQYLSGKRCWVGFTYISDFANKMRKKGLINEAGAEESNGFSILGGPKADNEILAPDQHVNDKDGGFAGLLMEEVACYAKQQGTTLFELLDDIYLKIGHYASANKPLPRVGSFEGAEGMTKKIRLLEKAVEWKNEANRRREAGETPFMLAGMPVLGAMEFKSGRYDARHKWKGFPDEGIRFFFPDDTLGENDPYYMSKNYITIRPSGTSETLRFYTQIFSKVNRSNIAEQKLRNYRLAEATSLQVQKELLIASADMAKGIIEFVPMVEKQLKEAGLKIDNATAEFLDQKERENAVVVNPNYQLLNIVPHLSTDLKTEGKEDWEPVIFHGVVNVKSNTQGTIDDATRLDNMDDTLTALMSREFTPVLIGHNGSAKKDKKTGKWKDNREELDHVYNYLKERWPGKVVYRKAYRTGEFDASGREILDITKDKNGNPIKIEKGKINILENVRLDKEQGTAAEQKDFAGRLMSLAGARKIYIADDFADIGSKGASVEQAPYFANEVYVGPAMVREFNEVRSILEGIDGIVFGSGEKLDDKLPLLKGLLKAIKENGLAIMGSGPSAVLEQDSELYDELRTIAGDKLIVASDYSDSNKFDIGEQALEDYLGKLDSFTAGQVLIVNGTMGFMEHKENGKLSEKYSKGTDKIFNKLKQLAKKGVKIVVVGGDAGANAKRYGLDEEENVVTFTGGGVPLKIIVNKLLSGIKALGERQKELEKIKEKRLDQVIRGKVVKETKKVAIVGMGRIGRLIPRLLYLQNNPNFEIAAIVGTSKAADQLKYAKEIVSKIKYDSEYRTLNIDIKAGEDKDGVFIDIQGKRVPVVQRENDISNYPWAELGIDIVFEATGKAKKLDQATAHIKAGAKKVLITAPGDGVPGTYVYGVNEKEFIAEEDVNSNASCTTNCIAPTMKVLGQFGFDAGSLNSTHAATNSQSILDKINVKKPEQGFSALKNIILTSTGASKALKQLGRKIWARMSGSAYRVATGTVSVITLDGKFNQKVTAEELKAAFKKAAEGELKGILAINDASATVDVLGLDYGAVVSEQSVKTMDVEDGTLVHMQIWYDNEWGYAAQLIRMAEKLAVEMENSTENPEVYKEKELPAVLTEDQIDEPVIPAEIAKVRRLIDLDKPVRVGINGMGRIGRLFLRQSFENDNIDVAAIAYKSSKNDVKSVASLVKLIQNDSAQGRFEHEVTYDKEHGNWIDIKNKNTGKVKRIAVLTRQRNTADLDWASIGGVDVAVENVGGNYTKVDVAEGHLSAGARKVIIGAPAKAAKDGRDADGFYVFGVNDSKLTPEQKVISNASCTTNALAGVADTINKTFGINAGFMSTTHAPTASQPIIDQRKSKDERSRAGWINIVLTSTGAAKAIAKVIPALKGKLDGDCLRVPGTASIIKLTVETEKPVKNAAAVVKALKTAADGYLKGIIKVDNEAVASTQITGTREASIVNPDKITVEQLANGKSLVTIHIWYDNESGYAQQEIRMVERMGQVMQENDKLVEQQNEQLIKELKAEGRLQDYDERYLRALYKKSKERKAAGLEIGENFIPSSMMSSDKRKNEMGAVNYSDIANTAYRKAAKNVVLIGNPMDGGLGSSFLRKEYLLETVWPQVKARYSEEKQRKIEQALKTDKKLALEMIELGAKGTDTFFDIELPGFDELGHEIVVKERVSVTELKFLQALIDKDAYGNVIIQELVNEDSEGPMDLFLDKTVFLLDRVDRRKSAEKRTYRELIELSEGIELADEMIKQGALPTIDKAFGNLTRERTAPGGYGQLGSMALQDALTVKLPEGKTLIRALYNGDGPNNFITPEVAGYMAKERIPIVMITTEKTSLDMKGGMLGLEILPNGKQKTQIMEKAQAEEADQLDRFQKTGLPSDDPAKYGEAGKQFFNTNVAAINYTVLAPFLRDLQNHMKSQGKADEFAKIVTPDLMRKVKKQDGKEFIQLEGAMGSALLNLNGFIQTTDDVNIKALLEKHRLKQLLYIVNFDAKTRNEIFTPVKFAYDFWFYAYSDHFAVNPQTFKVENKRPGHLPAFDLDGYYKEVSNCVNSFGHSSTIDLDSLTIRGKVKMVDVILRGTVEIISEYEGVFDLNTVKDKLGYSTAKQLLLEDVAIKIDAKGNLEVTKKLSVEPKPVSFEDVDRTIQEVQDYLKIMQGTRAVFQAI